MGKMPPGACLAVAGLLAAGPAAGQTRSPLLRGTLVGPDGKPVVAALVYLDSSTTAEQTDSSGEFRLAAGRRGRHILHLRRLGFAPRNLGFTLRPADTGQVELGVIALAPGVPPDLQLRGAVADLATHRPVVAAAVLLNSAVRGLTNARGAFFISRTQAGWGNNQVEIRRVGYQPLRARVWVDLPKTALELTVSLKPTAVTLDAVVVEGDPVASGGLAGFYRRKGSDYGRFITATEIEQRHPQYLTDLMRTIPGMGVMRDGRGNRHIVASRADNRCPVRVYLDGTQVWDQFGIDWMVPPKDVAGIEVYPSPARVPPLFNAVGSSCGVVAVWTKSR